MADVFLGLGSNLGDRAGHLKAAISELESIEGIETRGLSPIFRATPVGEVEQGDFLNMVARIETAIEPEPLLERCLDIERSRGRERTLRWGPRTLDIDLLLYGDERVSDPRLKVPHPEMWQRAFVLAPLLELAPEIKIGGRPVADCLSESDSSGVERLLPFEECQAVAIVGASSNPERYAHRAQAMLEECGHSVIPVNPSTPTVRGVPVFPVIGQVNGALDTVTLYVGPTRQASIVEDLVEARPRRVIFNPGTESADSQGKLRDAGIQTLEACTLVLLQTGRF